MVNDRIADSIFQQLQRPDEYSILATMNLNGDYLSDAAAAIVGGFGMAPGANIGDDCAILKLLTVLRPNTRDWIALIPVILSGVMMLSIWVGKEAADLIKQESGSDR